MLHQISLEYNFTTVYYQTCVKKKNFNFRNIMFFSKTRLVQCYLAQLCL